MGVAPSQTVVPCTVYCNTLISILSLQGFQLPTFHAGWYCNLLSLSSGVSTANLLCWMVLIRCNLSLSSRVSTAILSHSWGLSAVIFLLRGFNCQSFMLVGTVIFLSPWGFQLSTFRAGWCCNLLLGGFNCQPFVLDGDHPL